MTLVFIKFYCDYESPEDLFTMLKFNTSGKGPEILHFLQASKDTSDTGP